MPADEPVPVDTLTTPTDHVTDMPADEPVPVDTLTTPTNDVTDIPVGEPVQAQVDVSQVPDDKATQVLGSVSSAGGDMGGSWEASQLSTKRKWGIAISVTGASNVPALHTACTAFSH
jgi:hypothetical protein